MRPSFDSATDVKRSSRFVGHCAQNTADQLLRLGLLADNAKLALAQVASGETTAIDGWLAYGDALNEGRALFASDEQFGQWVKGNLPDTEQKAREAAMWASANPTQFTYRSVFMPTRFAA